MGMHLHMLHMYQNASAPNPNVVALGQKDFLLQNATFLLPLSHAKYCSQKKNLGTFWGFSGSKKARKLHCVSENLFTYRKVAQDPN